MFDSCPSIKDFAILSPTSVFKPADSNRNLRGWVCSRLLQQVLQTGSGLQLRHACVQAPMVAWAKQPYTAGAYSYPTLGVPLHDLLCSSHEMFAHQFLKFRDVNRSMHALACYATVASVWQC